MSQDTVAALTSLCSALALLFTPGASLAQGVDPTERDTLPAESRVNPFADFETHYLSNGLKVWFKRLEDAPNVSLNIGVPYGSDLDPRGKEQLAHFTEHMLFSDHNGRTEREIKDAIEGLGGSRNGVTSPDHTFYYVTIAREHGLFAIEWLSQIMSPHTMDPELVARGRQPVAVEIGAGPRDALQGIAADLDLPWLRDPAIWREGFGMATRRSVTDPWAALLRIGPEDLRDFYDQYYAPGAMTLTIVGDLDRDETLAVAERAFGSLPERAVPPQAYAVRDPGRHRATYSWGFESNVSYLNRFRVFSPTAEDELHLLFIQDLLFRRLNQRLRYGERKAAYTFEVSIRKRGPAAYLRLSSELTEQDYDYALQVVAEELEYLRTGNRDPIEFEEDRRALTERLRTANLTAQSLGAWARLRFYDPGVYSDFPDVLAFYEQVSQESLASFAAANLIPEREFLSIAYVHPVSEVVLVSAVLLLFLAAYRGIARALTRPIEMAKIRYVARFRTPLLIRLGGVALFAGLALVLVELATVLGEWMVTIDSYAVHTASYALMLSAALGLVMGCLALFPSKILVFPDHIRVKSMAFASSSLVPEDIVEISLRRFRSVWFGGDIRGCIPLTFGLRRPGLFIRFDKGKSLFFRTRDTDELKRVLEEWRGQPIELGASIEISKESAFDWNGSTIAVESWVSRRYAFLAAEQRLLVDGKPVAKTGGFKSWKQGSGEFVGTDGLRHEIRYSVRNRLFAVSIDGIEVSRGTVRRTGWLRFLA